MDFEWKHHKFSQPFIKELRQEKRQYGGKILRTFIISSDREKFYKVCSSNYYQALTAVMHIGENPPASTPAPPAPGKKRVSKELGGVYSMAPLSKHEAYTLIRMDSAMSSIIKRRKKYEAMKKKRNLHKTEK